MKEYILQVEDFPNGWNDVSEHDTYDEAVDAAGELFDKGNEGDFRIHRRGETRGYRYHGYTFVKETCPACGKDVRRYEMERTYDCHRIPYRLVCPDCYTKIMEEKGYDGEMYSAADENLDYDY